jgi:hypothetical protein
LFSSHSSAVEGAVSKGFGTIQFNAAGKLMSLATVSPIQAIPANNADSINVALLDMHLMTQYQGKSFGAIQQDGSPASR